MDEDAKFSVGDRVTVVEPHGYAGREGTVAAVEDTTGGNRFRDVESMREPRRFCVDLDGVENNPGELGWWFEKDDLAQT